MGKPNRRARRANAQEPLITANPAVDAALRYGVYPLLLLVAIFFLTFRPINDPDCWFHMALGREVLSGNGIPKGDIFSYTAAGSEWISSGWLSSVFLEGLFRIFGPSGAGLLLFVFVVVSIGYLAVYFAACRGWGNKGSVALVLLGSLLAGYLRFVPRPDVWSQSLAPLLVLLLVAADASPAWAAGRCPRIFYAVPFLFVAWANLHAGFMAGLIVIGVYGIHLIVAWYRTRQRGYLVAMVVCGLSFLVWAANPYGWRLLALAGKIKAIPEVNIQIFEWMPFVWLPGYNLPWPAYLGVAIVVAASAMAVVRAWGSVPLWRLAVAGIFLAFGLYQRRQMGLAALVIPAALVAHLGTLDILFTRMRWVLAGSVAAGSALICWLKVVGTLEIGFGMPEPGRNCRALPCLVTEFLVENRPPANMFNSYNIGGYLLYFLGPQTKVMIDGRLDIYDPVLWKDYLATEEDRYPLSAFVHKHGINSFAIDSRDSYDLPEHLAYRLARTPEWALVYFDDEASVFVRRDAMTDAMRDHAFEHLSPWLPERFVTALKSQDTRQAALSELARARAASQDSANAMAFLAMAAIQFGDMDSARNALNAALARDPESFLARQVMESATTRNP